MIPWKLSSWLQYTRLIWIPYLIFDQNLYIRNILGLALLSTTFYANGKGYYYKEGNIFDHDPNHRP